jgi:ABC-type Zn uptake system ZnuABC Zn-binding protein ZnuA
MKEWKTKIDFWIWIVFLLSLAACSQQADITANVNDNKLKIVATTTIIGDVVSQIGGDLIDLHVLLPVGTDPHSFDPTPQDIAKVAEADMVFANGAGLEAFLDPLIGSAGVADEVVHLSEGIDLFGLTGEDPDHEGRDGEAKHTGTDPHTWTNPNNVIVWVQNIEQALIEKDPENAVAYQKNAKKFVADLKELDTWIRQQINQIPLENRKLVTDHALFGYYAQAYDLEQVGALIPGYSTLAEASAQELADIEDAIKSFDIKAVFVGNTINPSLAERVAEDTGIQLIFVYTGSLSELDGEAGTYIDYMRYNTNAFVNALK